MAEVEGLTLKISGDSSDAVKELQKLSESLDGVKNADVKVTLDISQAQSEAEKLSNTLQTVGGAHVDITADGSQAIGEVKKVSEDTGKLSNAHAKITADSSQAIDEVGKVSDAIGKIEGSNVKITADGSQAVSEAEKVQAVIDMLQGKEIDLKINYVPPKEATIQKFTGPIVRAAEKAADEVSKTFKESFKEAAEAADQVSEHFESGFGLVLGGIIAKISGVVAGLGSVISSSLLLGGGFEAQMTSVKVITGATADELDELTKKAREMGAALPISAKDAATAMTLLAQRGTSVKDILATVEDVSNLAISQGVDMGTAADMLGTTLTNFGISVENASKVTAIFNNASNQSAMNISKMVEALKYVGPTAGSVGMELTEAMSAMEALANAGLTGEMIGTGLTGVLTKLASKTEILGVSTQEANGKLRPLADIFSELQAKGFSLSEATAVFGARGRLAALNLAKQSASLKENEERLKSWGSTQAAVDEKAKTFTNTMAAFSSAVEELHIEIFEQIKVQSKDAVGAVTELTRSFSKWLEETKLAQKILEGFMEGLGLEIPNGNDFRQFLDELDVDMIVEKFKGFGVALTDLVNAIIRVKDVIEAPLEFIIEHMEAFATVTFWGWIFDKALAIPAALMRLGASFINFASTIKTLYASVKSLISLSLLTPAGIGIGLGMTLLTLVNSAVNKVEETRKAAEEANRLQQEVERANENLQTTISRTFKTGFEELPASYRKASEEAQQEMDKYIGYLQSGFRDKVGSAVNSLVKKIPELSTNFNMLGTVGDEILSDIEKYVNGDVKAFDELSRKVSKLGDKLKGIPKGEELLTNITHSLTGDTGAFEALKENITELQTKFQGMGQVSNEILSNIAKSLEGDEKAFNELPEIWKQVTEELYKTEAAAGKVEVSWLRMYHMFEKWKSVKRDAQNILPENEIKTFTTEITRGLSGVLATLPGEIERAEKFLSGQNAEVVMNISLSQAYEQLDKFAQATAEKVKIPKDIVKEAQLNQLKKLASQGNETAQMLVNSWKGAASSVDNFLQGANDAITYLGASPEKFLPALNALTRNIQKIDPLTGKVTEQFKKAHNALKQWASVTFDQLSARIQRLRKAVEGGFLNERALKKEFDSVLKQATAQVQIELKPMEESLKASRNYEAVVASEVFAKMQDLGGDIFVRMMQEKFPSIGAVTGEAMGRALLSEVNKNSNSGSSIKINGVEYLQKFPQDVQNVITPLTSQIKEVDVANFNISSQVSPLISGMQNFTASLGTTKTYIESNTSSLQRVNDSLVKFTNSLGTINSSWEKTNYTVKDYSSEISEIVKEIQNVSSGLSSLQSISQANISAINSVEAALNSQNQAQELNIDESGITQAIISGISPLISRLEQNNNEVQNTLMPVSRDLQNLAVNIENLRKTTEASSTVMQKLQTLNTSSSGQDLNAALSPLLNVLQNVLSSILSIQNLSQGNISAINEVVSAVKQVESAVKTQEADKLSINEGSITQAVISGFNPLLSRLEQNSSIYQTSSAQLSKGIQELGGNFEELKKSTDNNLSAMSQLQASFLSAAKSYEASSLPSAITPLIGIVQSLLSELNDLKNTQQVNSSSVQSINEKLQGVVAALRELESGNTYEIEINQEGFVVEKKSDADMLARTTLNALRSGLGNGGL